MASEFSLQTGYLLGGWSRSRETPTQKRIREHDEEVRKRARELEPQILPKDLLLHARKVEDGSVAKAVANEIAKARKNGSLSPRVRFGNEIVIDISQDHSDASNLRLQV